MTTPNLALEPLVSAQAQKHVTVNEAFARIDAATQLAVLDRDGLDPPASPDDGDRYLLPVGVTGAWSGQDGRIAVWEDATVGWLFLAPRIGWRLWLIDESMLVVFTDTGWQQAGGGSASVNPATDGLVGVNTTADATNRLAVKSDAALFSHDDVTPGSGDMRLTLNKESPLRDTSLTFQTAFSTRAQIGLTGDDDLSFKSSVDGADFTLGATLRSASGIFDVHRLNSDYAHMAKWSASGTYNAGHPNALSERSSANLSYWANDNSLPVTLEVEIFAPRVVRHYKILRVSTLSGWKGGSAYSPRAWTFEGSNDKSGWAVLDTRSNQAIPYEDVPDGIGYKFANDTPYLYHRFVFTESNSGNWVHITEIHLHNE